MDVHRPHQVSQVAKITSYSLTNYNSTGPTTNNVLLLPVTMLILHQLIL